MSTVEDTMSSDETLVRRFAEYLNGPKGTTVLQVLDEGESFLLRTTNHAFKVTKSKGRAVVNLLNSCRF